MKPLRLLAYPRATRRAGFLRFGGVRNGTEKSFEKDKFIYN
jgi:hypothetical protein